MDGNTVGGATVSKDDAAIVLLIIGLASGMFASFCPSWFTVSSPFFNEQSAKAENIKRIRWGAYAATAVVVGTAIVIDWGQSSKTPVTVAVITCAGYVAGYEYMIAHPAKEVN